MPYVYMMNTDVIKAMTSASAICKSLNASKSTRTPQIFIFKNLDARFEIQESENIFSGNVES